VDASKRAARAPAEPAQSSPAGRFGREAKAPSEFSIEVVESAWAAERLEAAGRFLETFPPSTEILLVGASRDAVDDLARDVTRRRGASFGLHRYSLTQLAARLALGELTRRGLAPSSGLATEAMAARVAFEALDAGALRYFAPVARFPGFARALAATLGELRQAWLEPAALEGLGGAADDVVELLRRFEARLEEGGVSDHAGLLALAADAVMRGEHQPARGMPILFLDVEAGSAARRRLLAALAVASPSVLFTVPAGDGPTLEVARALAARSTHRPPEPTRDDRPGPAGGAASSRPASDGRMTRAGGDPSAKDRRAAPSSPLGMAAELARLRAFLFSDASPPELPAGGEVILFSAPGESREAVEVVRRILEEARAGTRFDRMAVLLRAAEVYATPLEAALARAGIPAYFARGTRRPDPGGRAFLALLHCTAEKLSARRFAEYLSLGQVPALAPEGTPPLGRGAWQGPEDEVFGSVTDASRAEDEAGDDGDPAVDGDTRAVVSDAEPVVDGSLRAPWRWEELLVESAVIGGEDRWCRRLAGLEAELRLRIEELRQEEPDTPRLQALTRELGDLQHLARFALPVIERLAALPASARWGEWIPALERLAPMVLRRPERVLAVLADLRPLGPVGPVSLEEVRAVLAEQLASLRERPPADRYGRVFVGTVEEVRGRAFDVVFLCGLAERIFPRKPREDPILLDALRERLASRAPASPVDPTEEPITHLTRGAAALLTQSDRAHNERLLLRLAVGAATRRLYLSYSRIDLAEARPRVASFYALEVKRALAGRIPPPTAVEQEAEAAAAARLAWPAPADPMRAIDEVEHDLSILGALLPAPLPDARGRARYLLELNDCLARSLRTRWARWESPKWSPADGIVRVADGTREGLEASRLGARAYSPSALQRFAACPYQFYLSAICRLEPRDEIAPLEQLDPLTRGHLFHRVQAELLRALQTAGRLPLAREGLAGAMATLDETLDRVEAEYREELAPAIERVWRAEIEAVRVDLRMWLQRAVEIQATWEPVAFELGFGLPVTAELDPRSAPDEVRLPGGFRLRGVIDLVERQRGTRVLRVTDYKTGRNTTRSNLVVGRGETLQPVLYGLAVEQVLGAPALEGRLFFCTRVGEFAERVVPLSDAARARAVEVLEVVARAVAAGFLPPAPRKDACRFCDFREVCGPHEELRLRRKDPTRLAELAALREWP
jgi:RecB family exonuclease